MRKVISQDILLKHFKICDYDNLVLFDEKNMDHRSMKCFLNEEPIEPENFYNNENDMRFCQSSQNDMGRHYRQPNISRQTGKNTTSKESPLSIKNN